MDIKEMLQNGASAQELREIFDRQLAAASAAIKQEEEERERAKMKIEEDARHSLVMAAIRYMNIRGYITKEEVKAAMDNSEKIEAELKEMEEEYIPYIRMLKDIINYKEEEKSNEADEVIARFLKGLK